MSFTSMHNDYLDPDRHLWQDYEDDPAGEESVSDTLGEETLNEEDPPS